MNTADILGTGLFDLERAQQAPGWVRELNGDHVPETEEYGISSTVFRADAPFHPGRLWSFVTEGMDSGNYGRILRSKGFFWLAGRPHVTGLWSQAGSVARFEPSGSRAPGDSQGQELVFIGTGLHTEALQAALTDCLLADREQPTDDPFPAWDTYGNEHDGGIDHTYGNEGTYGIEDPCEHEHPDLVPRA